MLLFIMRYIYTGLIHYLKMVFFCLSLCWVILLVACQPALVDTPQSQTPYSPSQNPITEPNPVEVSTFSSATIIDTTEYIIQERMALVNKGF